MAGYKNKKTAGVMWGPLFKKLKNLASIEADDDSARGTKRKAQDRDSGSTGSDRSGAFTTPCNPKRGRKVLPDTTPAGFGRSRDFMYTDDGGDDDELDFNKTPSKKPATNTTAAAADDSMDSFKVKKEKKLMSLGLMEDDVDDDLTLLFNHDVKTEDHPGDNMLEAFYHQDKPADTGYYAEGEA